jgi:hypothetical protein
VEGAIGRREGAPDVYHVVDVFPPEAEDLLAPQAKAERQVDGGIPRIGTCGGFEDLPPELRVENRETRTLANRAVDEFGCRRVPVREPQRG